MSDEPECVHQVLDQDAGHLIWRKSAGRRSAAPFVAPLAGSPGRSDRRAGGSVRAPLLALALLTLAPLVLTPLALTALPLTALCIAATATWLVIRAHRGGARRAAR